MRARGSLIKSLLRIFTPEEINELTSTSDNSNRIPLTEMITERLSEGAKILPFRKKDEKVEALNQESSKVKSDLSSEEKNEEGVNFEGTTFAGAEVQEFIKKNLHLYRLKMKANKNKVETPVFILQEKKKFEESVHKLKGAEILGLYKKTASVNVEEEKAQKEEMGMSSTQVGVLINKKQA